MVKDTNNSKHYNWGNLCDGWHLVDSPTLSVIREKMPSGASENLHFHNNAQQFFFILSGMANFEVEGEIFEVHEGQGFHVLPKKKHRILNNKDTVLEFIVISEPKSHGDRINL
ncbi:Mannose-6-phosphate isomerase, cupin superfamily [Parapedobacter composti]|uniref:Mannose-6-phosphate isomerase, cupin superfamily n=1 Tax=Parapedobacter composti TaxID=623281 RepID=A0A1I1MJ55_9SPHI|nr:cupin domain-containing protein [Parapedobacter composti]SFC83158.1 Mannose-6-phosphate isomerase, cupin superfamily [Parapedobacter composti]